MKCLLCSACINALCTWTWSRFVLAACNGLRKQTKQKCPHSLRRSLLLLLVLLLGPVTLIGLSDVSHRQNGISVSSHSYGVRSKKPQYFIAKSKQTLHQCHDVWHNGVTCDLKDYWVKLMMQEHIINWFILALQIAKTFHTEWFQGARIGCMLSISWGHTWNWLACDYTWAGCVT